jgi:hypothetical protein
MHPSLTDWWQLFSAALIQYPPLSIVAILCPNLDAKDGLIKECEAPELNNTTTEWLLTRNLPAVTISPAKISSIVVK